MRHILAVSFLIAVAVCLIAIDAQSCEHDLTLSYDAPVETDCDAIVYDDYDHPYRLTAYDDGQCWYVANN